jgi:hypothetical protein
LHLFDGRTLTNRPLYIEALRVDPKYAYAYHNLGTTLSVGETVTLPDGRTVTNRQLYIETLRPGPEICLRLLQPRDHAVGRGGRAPKRPYDDQRIFSPFFRNYLSVYFFLSVFLFLFFLVLEKKIL